MLTSLKVGEVVVQNFSLYHFSFCRHFGSSLIFDRYDIERTTGDGRPYCFIAKRHIALVCEPATGLGACTEEKPGRVAKGLVTA